MASRVRSILLAACSVSVPLVMGLQLPLPEGRDNLTTLKHDGTRDRYVFMVGLEGAGHHFFETVFEDCVASGKCGMRDTDFYVSLHQDRSMPSKLEKEWLRNAPGDGRLYPLNTVVPKPRNRVKMLSYPDARHNPNLASYAQVAKDVGDELKVVVMLRNATELLHSDLSRWGHDEDRLLQSGEIMLEQLKAFPKDQIICMWFQAFGRPDKAKALSSFLGLDVPQGQSGFYDFSEAMVSHFSIHKSNCITSECERAKRLAQFQKRLVDEVCVHGHSER